MLVVLDGVGDAVVDDVAGLHADARETLATPMKTPTTAVRAAAAIRELNIVASQDPIRRL
jgi:hypothetical protein